MALLKPFKNPMKRLLDDYGYEFKNGTLFKRFIPGHSQQKEYGTFKTIELAARSMINVHDNDYARRYWEHEHRTV